MEQHDFSIRKIQTYVGPSYYLSKPAIVFNLVLFPDGPTVDFYKERVLQQFPTLGENYPEKVADLFGEVLFRIVKMDLDLYVTGYSVIPDGEEWTIAVEYLDAKLAKDCIYLASDWFVAMNDNDTTFDFKAEFAVLQQKFDKTLFGGPTIYSLVEGGVKRGVPVHYLFEENQFQWGYGKKQRRGRSTIFHTDGIKDTEFTSYKDMVGDFLELCGFPTPKGKNCFTEEEILAEAEKLGWPVVIKPVAGHKGQGVTTGIESIPEAKKAFNNIVVAAQEAGVAFEGALVQQQIYGYDHRILTIGGKFVACLKREPAFVVGDGKSTIKELIDADNELEIRADTARSPLCKIKLDADMLDFMKLRGLTPEVVPAKDEKVVLRRVANISAGGVSFNVTNDMHPENIKMAENIAKFLNVTALGIDVLAGDISQSWRDGNFGIIEINAGPGVFMHLAPAFGGSVDIPGYLMEHFFTKDFRKSRVPIIVGNYITKTLAQAVYEELLALKPDVEFGCVKTDGIYFNNDFFTHCDHAENCKILFRNPKLDIALVDHDNENIHDYGTYHLGHDVAILDKANYAERILERDLMPDGILIEITEDGEEAESKGNTKIVVKKAGEIVTEKEIADPEQTEQLIVEALKPFLKEILEKYE
jgi:cyanophycin synthetase